jgi:hypothetical protein
MLFWPRTFLHKVKPVLGIAFVAGIRQLSHLLIRDVAKKPNLVWFKSQSNKLARGTPELV